MKCLITAGKIREIIAGLKTEPEIVATLRARKIRYSYTTETGFLSIRIPCRKGCIRVYRTCSRTNPFAVMQDAPRPIFPVVRADDI